jgi:polyphosphate kinase 2 (PPK2 family)
MAPARAAPSEREKSQMYAQRYLTHLPAAGEVVIFDRSCYPFKYVPERF